MAFTLELEQSLQSIDSTVTMPYRDYTADAIQHKHDFTRSSIFRDDWFGPIPNDETHIISTGRWATTARCSRAGAAASEVGHHPVRPACARRGTDEPRAVHPARATCTACRTASRSCPADEFKSTLDLDWMGYINSYINGPLHGPVHIMTGGQWWAVDVDRHEPDQIEQWPAMAACTALWLSSILSFASAALAGTDPTLVAERHAAGVLRVPLSARPHRVCARRTTRCTTTASSRLPPISAAAPRPTESHWRPSATTRTAWPRRSARRRTWRRKPSGPSGSAPDLRDEAERDVAGAERRAGGRRRSTRGP